MQTARLLICGVLVVIFLAYFFAEAMMKKFLAWLKAYWYVPVFVLLVILGAVLGGGFVRTLRRPDKLVKKELAAIKAGKEAAQAAVDKGTETAVKVLHEQHTQTIKDFDAAQRAKLEAMKSDPVATAKWLSKLSS
jgi:uncharacterized integral membrane protein